MTPTSASGYEFKNAEDLTRWTRWSLYACLVLASLAAISGYSEYELLTRARAVTLESLEDFMPEAHANDRRQSLMSIMQVGVFIASGVLSLTWIRRAHSNIRALGAAGLDVTPGWAIGWFFIPLMNFWKPYEAMKQLWQASANPAEWQLQPTPALLGWWWAGWVTYSILSNVSFRMSMRADELESIINASILNMLSDIVMIPLSILFIIVVQRVHAMQTAALARVSPAAELSAASAAPLAGQPASRCH